MRCPQCGNEMAQGAAFCSRCGNRLVSLKPAAVREYMLATIRPSLWYFARVLLLGAIIIAAGGRVMYHNPDWWRIGFGLVALGLLLFASAVIAKRRTTWSVTSDRIIERRGLVARNRRELELADIRAVEVSQRFFQRLIGLGDVAISSAASADAVIRLHDIPDPEQTAETVRAARLKRLA
ncbi:MAG TPA: PH domain-containing protein [Candidatus Binataceae bacterium]